MLRTVRYLSRYNFLATFCMVGMFSIVCFFLTLLSGSADGLFARYYMMSPVLGVFCLMIFSTTTSSYYANLPLSMSCTRRGFYWGSQVILLLNTLLMGAVIAVSLVLPDWFGAEWLEAPMPFAELPLLLCMGCFVQELGAFIGYFAARHRWLMVLMFLISMAVLTGGTVLFLLGQNDRVVLPAYVPLALLAGTAVLGGLSWLPLSKYTVR